MGEWWSKAIDEPGKVMSIALSFYLGFAVADQSVVERLAIQLVNT
jgi:hypothetical protein